MPLMDGLARVLKGVVDEMADILEAIGADGDGARDQAVHVRPELIMLALAGAAAKGAQDRVGRYYNGLTERAAGGELDQLHEIVVVVLIELLACERDFDAVLTGDNSLVQLPAVFALDRGEQRAAGNDIRYGRRGVGEGQGELNDLAGRARLCGLLGGAGFDVLLPALDRLRKFAVYEFRLRHVSDEFELICDSCR